MTRNQLTVTLLSLLALPQLGSAWDLSSYVDWSAQDKKWHGHVNGEFKAGNERHISQIGMVLPLAQSENALLFVDFRGRVDDSDNEEFNIGLAYRKMVRPDLIFGAYGFFDRKTSYTRNVYDGATLGFEFLTEKYDFRVNGYLTETGSANFAPGPRFGNLNVIGGQVFANGQFLEERAYQGIDYEVGARVLEFGENHNEIRLFAGGYYFDNDAPGFPAVAGPRGRFEMRLFDTPLLGEGSRITLSGEVQWDQVRETHAFGGIAVQIPLGRTRGKGNPFGASSGYSSLSRLERRMLDPIVRDVDIVTNTVMKGDPEVHIGPLIFEVNGRLFQLGPDGNPIPFRGETSGIVVHQSGSVSFFDSANAGSATGGAGASTIRISSRTNSGIRDLTTASGSGGTFELGDTLGSGLTFEGMTVTSSLLSIGNVRGLTEQTLTYPVSGSIQNNPAGFTITPSASGSLRIADHILTDELKSQLTDQGFIYDTDLDLWTRPSSDG